MAKLLTGTVKKYFPDRRYGFIEYEGQEIHFKFDQGRGFTEHTGSVGWSSDRVMRDPKVGAEVVFNVKTNHDRPWINVWGYKESHDRILERVRARRRRVTA